MFGRHAALASAPLLLALAGCGASGPVAQPDPLDTLSVSLETEHLVFHHAPGDAVDARWQEAYHQWATAELGVTLPGPLHYYKYRDRAHMVRMTGRATNGWADPERLQVHIIWGRDQHEVVHVYSARVGRPSAFFNEGLAVAFPFDPLNGDQRALWHAEHVHSVAKRMLADEQLIELRRCVVSNDFRRYSSDIGYPEAGSFVLWLWQTHGLESVLEVFRRGQVGDSLATIEAHFRAIYGFSLTEAETDWHAFLAHWQG